MDSSSMFFVMIFVRVLIPLSLLIALGTWLHERTGIQKAR
jgi:hypothetical protein